MGIQKLYKNLSERWICRALDGIAFDPSRERLGVMVKQIADGLPPDARVLDAGAGNCMYAPLFSRVRYESADFCQLDKQYAKYGKITYVCDLSRIPVEDQRYDAVLLTQVLEHLSEPEQVLREMYRVLKPGGLLFASAPLYYPEHETPHDYFRYTQFGLKHLLTKTGFQVTSHDWVGGYYATLHCQLGFAAWGLPARPRHFGGGLAGFLAAVMSWFLKREFYVLAMVFARLDRRHKYVASGHCADYAFWAIRPKNDTADNSGEPPR